ADYLARSHRHPHRGDGEHQGNGIPRVFDWIGVGFLLPRVDQFGQAVGGTAWHTGLIWWRTEPDRNSDIRCEGRATTPWKVQFLKARGTDLRHSKPTVSLARHRRWTLTI